MSGDREHGREEYARHDPGAPPPDEEGGAGRSAEGGESDAEASPARDASTDADDAAASDTESQEAAADTPDGGADAPPTGAETPSPSTDAPPVDTDASEGVDGEADPLVRLAAERDEYLDLLRRERAEFENYRRRTTRERQEAQDRGAEQLVTELLSVLDNFGHVLTGAEDSDHEQLVKGVEMVHRELWSVLSEAGLEGVPGEGAPFDPNHHEAMMQVEAEESIEEPYVAEVLKPGYRFKGRVLRPALVSVAQ